MCACVCALSACSHTNRSLAVSQQAESGEVPHLMFYGPSGAGKKTRIMALLHAIYGPGVGKVKLERRVFKVCFNGHGCRR